MLYFIFLFLEVHKFLEPTRRFTFKMASVVHNSFISRN
jgi:hypothetical protein